MDSSNRKLVARVASLTCVVFLGACASTPDKTNPLSPRNFSDLKESLLRRAPKLKFFQLYGPFPFQMDEDYSIRISKDTVVTTDVFYAQHNEAAPLVIFQHGNLSYKEAHRKQAEHVASWGMHALVLQLPNEQQWMKNGKTIDQLVRMLYRWPTLLGNQIDVNQIILVGHSFGGTAVSVAAGLGAPIKGLVLLDPAVFNDTLKNYLKMINVPVMLLGADKRVFSSRKRSQFFRYVPENVTEISVKDSTHEDAQYPSRFSLEFFGFDPFTSEEIQNRFCAAIALSTFSIASTNSYQFAWQTLLREVKNGSFVHARRK